MNGVKSFSWGRLKHPPTPNSVPSLDSIPAVKRNRHIPPYRYWYLRGFLRPKRRSPPVKQKPTGCILHTSLLRQLPASLAASHRHLFLRTVIMGFRPHGDQLQWPGPGTRVPQGGIRNPSRFCVRGCRARSAGELQPPHTQGTAQ